VLGRPLLVTAGAEGSALGAAALGLHAIDDASTLESALETLSPGLLDADPTGPDAIVPDPADVAAYRAARDSAAGRLGELAAAADLLALPTRTPETDAPDRVRTPLTTTPATSGN
ncbi:MAG: hypothetical protein HOQ27_13990, partial [Dermatophilaceae bacterium]|nr:hypothetical protein [Dermatophilaceae bacterium]